MADTEPREGWDATPTLEALRDLVTTGIVDRLVSRGHVRRQPHAADRRRTQLVLTESGRREVVSHLLPMFIALDSLDRSFTAEERAVVERYLRGATEAFERVLET